MMTKKKRVTLPDTQVVYFIEDKGCEPCVSCCLNTARDRHCCLNTMCSCTCLKYAKMYGFDEYYCYFSEI